MPDSALRHLPLPGAVSLHLFIIRHNPRLILYVWLLLLKKKQVLLYNMLDMKFITSMFQRIKSSSSPENILVFILLCLGFVLRIRQYLIGRSLWVDEAMLSLNIINRDFFGLFKPLDYNQGAPIGFLLIEKIFNLLFGRNELALRLFPLLLGLLSVWVFYLLLKRFTQGTALVIALTIFVINPRLIYYSSEVKQYMADVNVIMILFLIVLKLFEQPSRKWLGILTAAGLLSLWLSHPSVFVLAGIGTTLFILYLQKRDFARLGLVAGAGVLWLANIALLYSFTLDDLRNNEYMREYWSDAFVPMPPWSDWSWYLRSFQNNMNTHFAITNAAWIALIVMLAGWIVLFLYERLPAITLAWILFFVLLASSIELYPSLERMVLFLIPIWILLVAVFLEFLNQRLRASRAFSLSAVVLISGYFFYGAVPLTFQQFISPKYFDHIRPYMEYLQSQWHDGDSIFVTNGSGPAFEYYAPFYGLQEVPYLTSKRTDYETPNVILQQVNTLKGKHRVWVLMSHVYEERGFNEKDFLLNYLNKNGVKIREFRQSGTSVYLFLYDLGE